MNVMKTTDSSSLVVHGGGRSLTDIQRCYIMTVTLGLIIACISYYCSSSSMYTTTTLDLPSVTSIHNLPYSERLVNLTSKTKSITDLPPAGPSQTLNQTISTHLPQVPTNSTLETSSTSRPISLDFPTSPEHSTFIVKSVAKAYQLCDHLEITIEARNELNQRKTYGGDYFWIWIFNRELDASAVADEVVDHRNGTYTASFRLHWVGDVTIAVSLVQSSEALYVFQKLHNKYPARNAYIGQFEWNNLIYNTPCHVSTDMYINPPPVNRVFCNYTDIKTGFPWFCLKLENMPCMTYFEHRSSIGLPFLYSVLSLQEMDLFSDVRPIYPLYYNETITVNPDANHQTISSSTCKLQKPCSAGLLPRSSHNVAGYYFRDQWFSLVCHNRQFSIPQMRSCLQNHTLYFYGDSTLRQWYEYLTDVLEDHLEIQSNKPVGPHEAFDRTFKFKFIFHHHGLPINGQTWKPIHTDDMYYLPNLIDQIPRNDEPIVVLLSLWAHFTGQHMSYYQQRWRAIKMALLRLKIRNSKTRVFIKSANTREYFTPDFLNWYTYELDKAMREIMSDVKDVTIIDVWDMTISHHTGVDLHPHRDIILQQIDMLFSFVCPVTGFSNTR